MGVVVVAGMVGLGILLSLLTDVQRAGEALATAKPNNSHRMHMRKC